MLSRKPPLHLEGYDFLGGLHAWSDKDDHNDWQLYPAAKMTSGNKFVVCKLTWRGKEGTYTVTEHAMSIEEAVFVALLQWEKFDAKRPG